MTESTVFFNCRRLQFLIVTGQGLVNIGGFRRAIGCPDLFGHKCTSVGSGGLSRPPRPQPRTSAIPTERATAVCSRAAYVKRAAQRNLGRHLPPCGARVATLSRPRRMGRNYQASRQVSHEHPDLSTRLTLKGLHRCRCCSRLTGRAVATAPDLRAAAKGCNIVRVV